MNNSPLQLSNSNDIKANSKNELILNKYKNYIQIHNTININSNCLNNNMDNNRNLLFLEDNLVNNNKINENKYFDSNLLINLKNLLKNNINIKEYLRIDPDDMDYDDAIKLDKRKFCQYFLDIKYFLCKRSFKTSCY